ncbi:MAG: queuosine precursor transporter [Bacteroidota bacterium]
MAKKENLLFLILGGFFITNALVAEFIGVKIFSLEGTLGWDDIHWSLFGIEGTLQFSAGVLPWPVVFIMTDIINEYYGQKGVKLLSYLTAGLIGYAFILIFMSIYLEPADWWLGAFQEQGVENAQSAFVGVYGQGLWIIIGSMVAFLIGQLLDAVVFHRLRKVTGRNIGLRATISTLVSQLFDSFIVLYIGFIIPGKMTLSQFFAIGAVNYSYKLLAAIILIPLLYVVHGWIRNYLGEQRAEALIRNATNNRLAA